MMPAEHTDIPATWWKDGYFFGRRYDEPDNNLEGYLPGKLYPETKRMEGSWETTDGIGRVIHPRTFYSVRVDTGDALAAMARQVGFHTVELFGSFTGEPFGVTSSELILIAHKTAVAGV